MLQCACEVTEQLPVSVFEAAFLVAGASPASLGASGDSPGSSLHLALQTSGLQQVSVFCLWWVLGEGFKLRFLCLQWYVLFPLSRLPDLDLKVQKSIKMKSLLRGVIWELGGI